RQEEIYEQELARGALLMEAENYPAALECLRQARSLPGCQWEERGLLLWRSLYTHFPRRNLQGARELLTVNPHRDRINAMALSPTGEWVATAGNDRTLQLWDPRTGDTFLTGQNKALGSVTALASSPDGRYLLAGGDGGGVQLWDAIGGRCQSRFPSNGSIPLSVSLSPDGGYAIAGFVNGELVLWEVGTRRLLRRWQGHQTPVSSVCFSPDGRYLFSCETGLGDEESGWGLGAIAASGRWKYWRIATAECLQNIPVGGQCLNAVCLSPDGHYGASAGSGGIALWAVRLGRCLRVLPGGEGAIATVDFSADGDILLSGGEDGLLRLWNVLTGKCTFIFEGHRDAIAVARLSADSRYMISASRDGACKVWTLDWDLAERETTSWDEGAKPYLEAFLWLHVPPAVTLPDTPRGGEGLAKARQPFPWSYLGVLFLLAWAGMAWAVEILTVGDRYAILLVAGSAIFVTGYYSGRQFGNPSVQLGSLFGVGVLVAVAAINVSVSWIPLASAGLGIGMGLVAGGAIAGLLYPYPVSSLPGLKACQGLKARLGNVPTVGVLLLVSWAGTQLEVAIARYELSPGWVCSLLLAILAAIALKQLWQSRQGEKPKQGSERRRSFSWSRLVSRVLHPSTLPRPSVLLQKLWGSLGGGGRAALLVAVIASSAFKWTLPSSIGITPPNLCQDPAVVRAYLDRGGNPNVWVKREVLSSLREEKRISLLQCALVGDRFEIARLLLARGVKADANPKSGRVTPLHIAADKSTADIVRALVARGADVNARDEYHRTPLHWVQSSTVARLLLEAGAEVNAFSRDRGTPLHWAVATNQLPLVELFLLWDADVNVKNSEGLTPLEFAKEYGREEIANVLQAGALDEI
ncbi:MAG: ankyrin repeat domain-containing protein, partial [Spirulina sp.]